MTASTSHARAILVGDRGIVIPKPQLVSTPYVHEVPAVVIEKATIDEDITVTTMIEYDGVVQDKEAMERAGFFSIVTAMDI